MLIKRSVVAVILLLGLVCTARTDDKDDKKADSVKAKLIGTWQVEKGVGLPVGSRVTFAKDGKVSVDVMGEEKKETLQGTYKIEGKTIQLTIKRKEKERTQPIKVTKIDDKELVLEGPKGETLTFKKVAKTSEKKDKE
jgi:uncharacterized protein (TIGR03066 family)